MNTVPAILGVLALVLLIVLVVKDYRNKKEEVNSPKSRLNKTTRGFIVIICLVTIFATLVFYWG